MKPTRHFVDRAQERYRIQVDIELERKIFDRIMSGRYASKRATDKLGVYKYVVYTDGNLILPGLPGKILVVLDEKNHQFITIA